MSYGFPTNYGGQMGYRECQPSTVPRPTGFCKRYAVNIPPPDPYVNPQTGVRRKVMSPQMDFGQVQAYVDTEVEDDFWQAEEDCRQEMYSNQQPSPMPWDYRQGETYQDPATKLEDLIRQEAEEIEQSMKYLRHAEDMGYTPQKSFRELATAHRMRAMANVAVMGAENLDPDVAAAMMASEEQGQALKHIPPAALFNRLFPEDNRKCTVLVRGASKYHRDHVKPERGAMLQDCLMSDVDAGILSYGEMLGRSGDEFLPQSLDTDPSQCPDGVCEPKKSSAKPQKPAKITKFKPTRVDDGGFELSWVPPNKTDTGFILYYSIDAKSKEWQQKKIRAPPFAASWNDMDPTRSVQVIHFALIPQPEGEIPPAPPKDAVKVDVKKPKPKKGSKGGDLIEILGIQVLPGGVELEWKPIGEGARYTVHFSTNPKFEKGKGEIVGQARAYEFTKHKLQTMELMDTKYFGERPVPEGKNVIYIKVVGTENKEEPGEPIHSQVYGYDLTTKTVIWPRGSMEAKSSITSVAESEYGGDDTEARPKPPGKIHYYTVSSMPPLTGNFIQLRGSQPPPWFPGYYTVQPGVPRVTPLDEMSEALEKAWSTMGPSQVDSPHGSFLLGKP